MSNKKTSRNLVLVVLLFGGFGELSAQSGATSASNSAKAERPAASAKASAPAKNTNTTAAQAKEANTSTSASKKKPGNTVKPPKLAKETFSYIPYAELTLKDGRAYKTGEDQPYTGYVWATREDLRNSRDTADAAHSADETDFPGEDVRLFLYLEDGKPRRGEFLHSKYVPEHSAIWETKKRQGVTTISIYVLRDNVKDAIANDNFFERKDACFYLIFRTRIDGDVRRVLNEQIELFDRDGTRVLSVVHRQDDSSRFEALGEDGIFCKFTKNRKTGRLDSPMEAYHPNGKLFYQTVYTDGDPGSIVELYDPSGQKAFRCTSRRIRSRSGPTRRT